MTDVKQINLKERCYQFSLSVLKFSEKLSNGRGVHIIENQLIRCATSIGANVTEARGSTSKLEFKKFYEIALKSANETVYWLSLLRDAKYAQVELVDPLIVETIELSKILGKSVMTLKQGIAQGSKSRL